MTGPAVTFRKLDHPNPVWADKYPDLRQYEVSLAGKPVGVVWSKREESWERSSSGIRVRLVGHPKSWCAKTAVGEVVTTSAWDRAAAVKLLLDRIFG